MYPPGINIVAIGGGTGLSTLLRGLKAYVGAEGGWSIRDLAAIVTVTDEGGSSGLLRRELSMLPPGDVRNCIVALAEEEQLLSRLFNYRFEIDSVKGHSLGNLLLAGLTEITGSFDRAILAASEVLAISGSIYPSTLSDVRLRAETADGKILVGETEISGDPTLPTRERPSHARITRLGLEPADVEPVDDAIAAIELADVIVIGPGSLYTSILPNLAISRLAEAIRTARALRIYVCNVMTQPGETDDYTAQDHLAAIVEHAGLVADVMVINGRRPSEAGLAAYALQGQRPVEFEVESVRELGVTPFFGDIISEGDFVRHDPERTAETVFRVWDRYGARLQRLRREHGWGEGEKDR
jgi:uncharacterized cofD-like protein